VEYFGIFFSALVLCVMVLAARRYIMGVLRLRGGLGRVAREDLAVPLMLDLPRGLRSAERDLKSIASRIRGLEREASQERFGLTAILGSISEGVFIVDRGLRIRLSNPGLTKMFQLTVPPVGRSVMEVFRSHDLHRLVSQGVADGRPHHGEVSLEQGMTLRTFELSISPLVLDDGETGAVVVVHNITKIKTLERVRREFVANVSHELRTPLTIINGYLETLVDGGLDDRTMAEGALRVMAKHGDRLAHLVEDLLIIAQAESHAMPLDLEPVELRGLLRRVIEQVDEPIRARGAEVRITSAEGDTVLEADSRRLEQVFLNLLDNALKYGNRPGLTVDFYIELAGPNLHVRVVDNGPGIPYEDQVHIFERFYRVHKHRSRETGGTGLGLSIVKNVIQAHGGDVSLQSMPGSGSTFQVVLPVEQPKNQPPRPD